ncbi:MAG: YfiR family protein [Sterolibacteriaceae bacterium MAG5]|nr:YfiR family protein [Candidatus Nitricoxidireducens bremensis]
MTPKRLLLLMIALLVPAAPASAPVLATETVTPQAVRAALVYNFIKLTGWPAPTGPARLRLCVATGDPAQMAAIEALGDRLVRGMPLAPVRFVQQLDCRVIYVDSPRLWQDVVDRQASGQALTIGSYPGFVRDGGMIEISQLDGQTRFDINLLEARRAGLHLQPQLLRLARRIVE